jgi:flagellar biosynthesis/type III secretory pathway protein FliH
MLEQWQRAHPEVETVIVQSRADLGLFDCLVESELGQVEGSLSTQLSAIRDVLVGKPMEVRE